MSLAHMLTTDRFPRIVTRADLLKNLHFEADALGANPSDWTIVNPGSGSAVASNDYIFDPGSRRHTRCLKVTRTAATTYYLTQKTAAGSLVIDKEHIFLAAIRTPGPTMAQIGFRIDSLNAADGAVQTNIGGSASLTSGWSFLDWNFVVWRGTPTTTAGSPTKLLAYLIFSPQPLNEAVYVAYMHFGLVSDFDRRFSTFEAKERPRGALNVGTNTYEGIELGDPETIIRFGHGHVGEGTTRDVAWRQFLIHARRYNRFVLWRDALKWTNAEGHFEKCLLTKDLMFDYRPGLARYPLLVEAVAPTEYMLADDVPR